MAPAPKGENNLQDVYFRCGECGKRILEPDGKNHTFREEDIPLRRIMEREQRLWGENLCEKCLGGKEMNIDGKNFERHMNELRKAPKEEREKLLDQARNDIGVTVAGYLKLEDYAMGMNGNEKKQKEGK